MKRYLIIILLLFILGEAEAQGQNPFNWWRNNDSQVTPVSYDADALVYFDRVETAGGTISSGRKLLISNFFVMLKDSLNSDTLTNDFDEFWFYAAEDSITGNTGWLRGWTSVTTGSATSTFKVDSGWIGQTNARLNTTFQPATDAVVYQPTYATWGYYSLTNNSTGNGYQIDAVGSWIIRQRYVTQLTINGNAENTMWGCLSYRGFVSAWRSAAWTNGYYWNDIQSPAYELDAKYGAGLPVTTEVMFGGSENGTNVNLIAFCYFGRYFTRTELNKINRCVEWYLNELNGFPYEYEEQYCERANQFFARCYYGTGTNLSEANKQWYNDSIFIPLLDSGLIGTTRAGDSLVALYSFNLAHAQNEEVAKLNLLDNRYYCVNVNGVVFTDSGCVGNGTSSYLNTYFKPTVDSVIYKFASASFGVYSLSNISEEKDDIGATSSASFLRGHVSAVMRIRVNAGLDLYSGAVMPNSYGLLSAVRNSSTMLNTYQNITNIGTSDAKNSSAIPNVYFYICASNSGGTPVNFATKIYAFAYIGSGLSADKIQKLSNISNTSLKGYGYNVY